VACSRMKITFTFTLTFTFTFFPSSFLSSLFSQSMSPYYYYYYYYRVSKSHYKKDNLRSSYLCNFLYSRFHLWYLDANILLSSLFSNSPMYNHHIASNPLDLSCVLQSNQKERYKQTNQTNKPLSTNVGRVAQSL
jgi:hypothetical protein